MWGYTMPDVYFEDRDTLDAIATTLAGQILRLRLNFVARVVWNMSNPWYTFFLYRVVCCSRPKAWRDIR